MRRISFLNLVVAVVSTHSIALATIRDAFGAGYGALMVPVEPAVVAAVRARNIKTGTREGSHEGGDAHGTRDHLR